VGVSVVGFWRYVHHDRPELIDSPAVLEVADSACMTMRVMVAVQAPPAGAGVETRIRAIRAQNASVTSMVARIEEVGTSALRNDIPAEGWLSDWESLRAAREDYADTLAAGGAPVFRVPESDGTPITARMDDVGLTCQVPASLLTVG
jgi:hypothetical protein